MSIRLRLTLLYTAVLAVTLSLFSVILYLRLDRNLRGEVDRSLRTRASREITPEDPKTGPNTGRDLPTQRISRVATLYAAAVLGDPAIVVQVFDSHGQLVPLPGGLNDETLPPPGVVNRPRFATVTVNHVPLRTYARPLNVDLGRPGTSFSPPYTIVLARSLVDTERALGQLRLILLLGTAGCLGLAAAAGWLLARNALRPIDRLTSEAQRIGSQQDFSRRVRHDGPNDEVGRLAGTFNEMLDGLGAAHSRLQRTLEAQRRFVADASHELRTPLTTIRGNVELLTLEGGGTADQQEALADIASEAERMSRLVNNLLALARADSGLRIARHPVPVAPVVAGVVQKAQWLAGEVVLMLGETVEATVPADRDYLMQLLIILVDNALKFTPAGGTVTVSSCLAGGKVRIAVHDTGPGIPMEHQARIFDRFYQADPSRHGGGTGLGLSIASWIARELDGHIELNSTMGEGSTFTIVLPLLANAGVTLPEPSPVVVPTR